MRFICSALAAMMTFSIPVSAHVNNQAESVEIEPQAQTYRVSENIDFGETIATIYITVDMNTGKIVGYDLTKSNNKLNIYYNVQIYNNDLSASFTVTSYNPVTGQAVGLTQYRILNSAGPM